MSNQKRWANGAADTSVATQPATSQLFARAVSLHLDGRGDEALVELERALRGGEKRAEIHSAIGYIHYERKQFDEATASYRRLLELESGAQRVVSGSGRLPTAPRRGAARAGSL